MINGEPVVKMLPGTQDNDYVLLTGPSIVARSLEGVNLHLPKLTRIILLYRFFSGIPRCAFQHFSKIFFNLQPFKKVMEHTNNNPVKTTLQNVVDSLINKLLPVARRNNSSIVNNVSPKLNLAGDLNSVASVIGGLLRSVISNARESCIQISAKELYGKMVMLSVRDSNSYDTYAVACGLQDVVHLAEKIGGHLDITSERQRVTTIAFCFPMEE